MSASQHHQGHAAAIDLGTLADSQQVILNVREALAAADARTETVDGREIARGLQILLHPSDWETVTHVAVTEPSHLSPVEFSPDGGVYLFGLPLVMDASVAPGQVGVRPQADPHDAEDA